jgi:hypothetical protein
MEKSEFRPFPPPEAVEINKGSNRPCSFAGQLRCSLGIDFLGFHAPFQPLGASQAAAGRR